MDQLQEVFHLLGDLNSASYEELQKLPGIGKIMAQRIIAHRPYKSVDDLIKVPGFGKKTIDRLRSGVCVPNCPRLS